MIFARILYHCLQHRPDMNDGLLALGACAIVEMLAELSLLAVVLT